MKLNFGRSILAIISFGLYSKSSQPYQQEKSFKEKMSALNAKFEPKRRRMLIFAGIQFWAMIIMLSLYFYIDFYSVHLVLLPLLLLSYLYFSPVNNYVKAVATDIFPLILSSLGDLDYKLETPYSMRDLQEFRIIPIFDREKNINYISGEYQGMQLEMFNSYLVKTDHKGEGVSYFFGLVVKIKVNKKFQGTTVIKKDFGILNIFQNESGLQNVALEDPEFENQFEVFSDDQIEARYLLTTSFMARLLKMQKAFACKNLTACFHDGHLLILLNRVKYSPKIDLNEPADFSNLYHNLRQETEVLFEKLKILKLEQNIGM